MKERKDKMKIKHVHQYQKMPYGSKGHEVFKCMIADCPHFMPQKELAIGRMHICWGCDKEMILNKAHMTVVKPKCDHCIENNAARLSRMANVSYGGSYDPLTAHTPKDLEQDEIDFLKLLSGEV